MERDGYWYGDLIDHAKDGRPLQVYSRLRAVTGPRGDISGVLELAIDVTRQRAAEVEQMRMAAIVEASSDAMVSLDLAGSIISWNHGAELLYGWLADEVLGRDAAELLAVDDDDLRLRNELRHEMTAITTSRSVERRDRTKRGEPIDVLVSIAPILDGEGTILGMARVSHDISQRKYLEEQLRQQAEVDHLTGLLNRRRLEGDLRERVEEHNRYGKDSTLIIFDLDGFKEINDQHGHRAGDSFLRSLAALLKQRMRLGDRTYRLGGDEFAVLMPGLADDGGHHVANALAREISAHEARFGDARLGASASFGVVDTSQLGSGSDSTAGPGSGAGVDPHQPADGIAELADLLLVQADQAMYAAKQAGGGVRLAARPRNGSAQAPADHGQSGVS